MTAKIEWTVVGLLAIAGVVTYQELGEATEQEAEITALREEARAEREAPLFTPNEAREIVATSLSDNLPQSGHWRGNSALIDLNQDGELDLVSSIRRWDRSTPAEGIYVWLGDGEGGWTEATTGMRRDMSYGGSDVADIDGDGHLDIAFSGHDVTPHVFFGDSKGKWKTDSAGVDDLTVICSDVALGDVDDDGFIDMAIMGFYPQGGGLYVYRNDGNGHFNRTWTLLPEGKYGSEVKLIDLEDDGKLELVAATLTGVHVWRYDPETDMFDETSDGFVAPEIGGSELAVDAADLDGDGIKELLVAGMTYEGHPALSLFRWDGAEWVSWGEGLPDDEPYFDATFARIHSTGPLSIVAAGKAGINIIDMVAPGRFERLGRIAGTVGVINVAPGDVTGDGRDEIAFVGFGGVRVLELPDLGVRNGDSQ